MADKRSVARKVLGSIFCGVALVHFKIRKFFAQLVPAQLAEYETEIDLGTEALMLASGVCFFAGKRRAARWMTLGFLVPTLPLAINQVRNPEQTDAAGVPAPMVIARIPAQMAMCGLIWWATQPSE